MDGLQRGSAAIVGIAESDLGAVAQEMSAIDLMAQGIQRALNDCGLRLRDVDGLLCATAQSRTSGLNLPPDRPPSRLGARVQSLRDAVPAVSAVYRLCAGGVAAYARVRHDAR